MIASEGAVRVKTVLLGLDIHAEVGSDQQGNVVVRMDESDVRHFMDLADKHADLLKSEVDWVS